MNPLTKGDCGDGYDFNDKSLEEELFDDQLEAGSGGILIGLLLAAIQKGRVNAGGLHVTGD